MKKLLTILLASAGIAAVMIVTCPDKQQHEDALQKVIDYSIKKSIGEDDTGLAYFGSFIGSQFINDIFKHMLSVDNYFVVSIGTVDLPDGESRHVSLGMLGHVFTIDKDEAAAKLEEIF